MADAENIRERCVRCGERRASVCPPSGLCSRCIVETMSGIAAPTIARKRASGAALPTGGFLSLNVGAE